MANPDAATILIAEDEEAFADALQIKLENQGFNVRVAHNGRDAIRILKEAPIDLILLDLIMPVMDGFAVLEWLRSQKERNPKVIILSNLGQEEDVRHARELGAGEYFIKTEVPLEQIVSDVRSLLDH